MRLRLILLLLVGILAAGCAGTRSASHTDPQAYRCSPKGRYGVPEAIMSCFAASSKPGEVLDMDLSPWEYIF